MTVKGFDIHMRLVSDNDQVDNSNGESLSTESLESSGQTSTPSVENGKDSDWKARYKQQIIDHLTLLITDVSISIQLLDESMFVLQSKDAELHTLQRVGDGKDETSALLQEVCLGSIAAWIQNQDVIRHSILDPISYHASVQRISGRRFLDGVLSGLMIQGKSWTNNDEIRAASSIRVHAEKHQLIGLNCLQKVLQNLGNDNSSSQGDEKDSTEIDSPEQMPEVSLPRSNASIIFRLPLQSIEIKLEDDSKLGFEGCEVRYCMDGTELALYSNGGFWMDGSPILKNGSVIVDFANSKLELDLDSSQHDNEVFYNAHSIISRAAADGEPVQMQDEKKNLKFKFSIDLFRRLYSSIYEIVLECQQAVALLEEAQESKLPVQQDLSTSKPWTITAKQPTTFHFAGHDNIWIRITGCGLVVEQRFVDNSFPFTFACRSAKLESFNGLTITFPSIEANDKTIVL